MTTTEDAVVLLVDDDPQILGLYEEFLQDAYDLTAVLSGSEALAEMSDDVDVVLLDRRMPGMKGTEVLDAIREQGYDCRVAMITAVEPDVDIVDMGFDDYLVKPVTRSRLTNLIDSLLHWDDYDALLLEYFEVARKVALLEENVDSARLDSNEDYLELKSRLSTLQSKADEEPGELDGVDFGSIVDASTVERPDADESDAIRYSS